MLGKAVREAWLSLLRRVAPHRWLSARLAEALLRGEGATTLTWTWNGDGSSKDDMEALLVDVEEAIRRAPSPLGADEFIIRLAAYGPRPGDEAGVKDTPQGRELLRFESLTLDRYYDWLRGDAKQRLRELLEDMAPSRQAPLVAVIILPLGAALAAVLREG